ncbi:oligosaccharide flippase family protein [Halogeometricum sp. CBA1124]|jgi:O-antigen/teichoic acid export membrane protein|uniref:oligosaccharide flippase family protein n=1 Tax=Halogeometricum sp. CBA1124 TaxID=2668071 RepID=UPI00142AD6E0|nr:oligosaccharide flippase family protein [Halogeometricum sp. CBA1124]MUV57115.1 oligosaccharide flippase family protein [Halogeometricum sp. CBA1124]
MTDSSGVVAEDGSESDSIDDLFQELLKGGGVAFGASLFSKAVGFVFNITLARFLGASGYGLFVLGLTVAHFAQPVALLGLPDGIVRYVSKYRSEDRPAKVRGTVLTSIGISAAFAVVLGAGVFLFAGELATRVFDEPELVQILPLFGLAVPFYVLLQTSTSVAVGFKRIEYQQVVRNVLFPLLKLGAVGGALLLGYQLQGAVSGLVVAVALASVAGVVVIPRLFTEIELRGAVDPEVSRLLRYSLPVFLSGFSYLALNQIDRLVLGAFRPSSAVGIYNASSVLSQQGVLFFAAIVTIFNPIASDLYSSGSIERLQTVYRTVTRWILMLSFPIAVVGSLFATELLRLFNAQFVAGVPILVLLFGAQLLYVAVGPAGELLQMSGFQDIVLLDTVSMLVVNVVLNLLLVPRYGAIGAAVATAVSISGVQLAELYQTKRYVGIQPIGKRYLYIVVIGGAFAAATYGVSLLSLSLVPRAAAAITVSAVYAALVWVFTITEEDKATFQSFVS